MPRQFFDNDGPIDDFMHEDPYGDWGVGAESDFEEEEPEVEHDPLLDEDETWYRG